MYIFLIVHPTTLIGINKYRESKKSLENVIYDQ